MALKCVLREQFGVDHLWFADDLFGINNRWVQDLADHVERHAAAVPFKMQSRADLMQEETVAAIARAGCVEVWMGVESGSQRILDAMQKGTRVEQVGRARKCPAHITVRNHSRWLPALSIAVVSPRQKGSKKVWHWQPTSLNFPTLLLDGEPWLRLRDLKLERTQKIKTPSILRQPMYFPYISPRGSAGAELALFFDRRGRYVQNAFGISTRFPFSFLLKTRKVVLNRELIVYPKVEQTEEFYEMLPLITGEFENHIRGRGHDLYRIRDYQPEDSARHVDWKSSAKTGVLKIREFAREDEHRLRIVFDNASPGWPRPSAMNVA